MWCHLSVCLLFFFSLILFPLCAAVLCNPINSKTASWLRTFVLPNTPQFPCQPVCCSWYNRCALLTTMQTENARSQLSASYTTHCSFPARMRTFLFCTCFLCTRGTFVDCRSLHVDHVPRLHVEMTTGSLNVTWSVE